MSHRLALALAAACAATSSAQVFVNPTSLDVTSVNGISSTEPIVTSDRNVRVEFSTDAQAGVTWIVSPANGAVGTQAVFPPATALGVFVPPESENTPFTIALTIKSVAPAAATTLPRFNGTGTQTVIVDTEPPEVTIRELRVGDRVIDVQAGDPAIVNGDFTVVGQVTDNISAPAEITLEARFGGSSNGETNPDDSGTFEIPVSVGSLSDGSYELEIDARDATDDQTRGNVSTFRMYMGP